MADYRPNCPGAPPIKASEIGDLIKKSGATEVHFRSLDLFGARRRIAVPAAAVDEDVLLSGVLAEGILFRPDLATARVDNFGSAPTISLMCDGLDPATKGPHPCDTRAVARRAHESLRSSGIADIALFGTTAACYVFDRSAADGDYPPINVAFPIDRRSETAAALAAWSVDLAMHRETEGSGQAAFDLRDEPLLRSADTLTIFKYIVKSVAEKHGTQATFMPLPLFGEPGSGLNCRQSLWKDGRPLFFDANGYAECSQMMLYYIGGLLTHLPSVLAFAAPSSNSYTRLASGTAPVDVAFSAKSPSAAIGISLASPGNPKAKRLDFRCPDASANPYLAFSAMLLAGMDGIKHKIDPVRAGFGPLDRPAADLPAAEALKIASVPRSLRESLAALVADRAYLTAGGVFTDTLIDAWIAQATAREIAPLAARPHPYEYALSFDV